MSLPSFFSFLFFSENSPPAAETAFFKKYPYRDNAARGEKERDEEKRETGVLCKKVPARFPSLRDQSRYFLLVPILMILRIAVAMPAAATTAPRTIVTIFRPCLILLPCLSFFDARFDGK